MNGYVAINVVGLSYSARVAHFFSLYVCFHRLQISGLPNFLRMSTLMSQPEWWELSGKTPFLCNCDLVSTDVFFIGESSAIVAERLLKIRGYSGRRRVAGGPERGNKTREQHGVQLTRELGLWHESVQRRLEEVQKDGSGKPGIRAQQRVQRTHQQLRRLPFQLQQRRPNHPRTRHQGKEKQRRLGFSGQLFNIVTHKNEITKALRVFFF